MTRTIPGSSFTGPASCRMIFVLAALVVIIAGMRAAAELVNPFLLSLFIAVITAPPYFWLSRKGIPDMLALLVVIGSAVFMMLGIAALLGGTLTRFTQDLPEYSRQLQTLMQAVLDRLAMQGITIPRDSLDGLIEPGVALRLVSNLMNGLGSTLGNGMLIFITVLFLLVEARGFQQKLRILAGADDGSLETLHRIGENINRYLAIKTLTSLATGLLIALLLWAVDVPYPILWGTLAFLLNYIPNIGSILAGIPPVLLSLVAGGPVLAGWTILIYIVVNNLIGNFLEPRLMGSSLGLSPLVILLSMIFWGWVLGPVGMFLSVPMTMTLRIALDSMPQTRGIALMLGPAPVPDR